MVRREPGNLRSHSLSVNWPRLNWVTLKTSSGKLVRKTALVWFMLAKVCRHFAQITRQPSGAGYAIKLFHV